LLSFILGKSSVEIRAFIFATMASPVAGFPKPLPPLDPEKLKETDDLIATGDAIVAKMNALISTLDLPKIKLRNNNKTNKIGSVRLIDCLNE
jgi:hypothetical protein